MSDIFDNTNTCTILRNLLEGFEYQAWGLYLHNNGETSGLRTDMRKNSVIEERRFRHYENKILAHADELGQIVVCHVIKKHNVAYSIETDACIKIELITESRHINVRDDIGERIRIVIYC